MIAVGAGVTRLSVLLGLVALLGCNRSASGDAPLAPLKALSAAELRVVPVSASLDLPLQASVYAWRDFMPTTASATTAGTASPVHDLMVSVQVRGGVVLPKVLVCDGIYLQYADSVFRARPAEQRAGDGPGAIECILRGGPEWPVGAEINVIISVGSGAQRALIRRETTIDATS